jgi:hypothetical protein
VTRRARIARKAPARPLERRSPRRQGSGKGPTRRTRQAANRTYGSRLSLRLQDATGLLTPEEIAYCEAALAYEHWDRGPLGKRDFREGGWKHTALLKARAALKAKWDKWDKEKER